MMRLLALAAITLVAVGCTPGSAGRGATLATAIAATPAPTSTREVAHEGAAHTPGVVPTPVVATAAPAIAAPVTVARPTPTLVNVDDMMGYFPQQTVFVATPERVSAVTLLNHFTRYRVATNGMAQLAPSSSGTKLFVLDANAAGGQRLRALDVASGAERAAQGGLSDVVLRGRVLSGEQPGRVLVLKADMQHAWVEAYDAASLRPLGTVADAPACTDLLFANAVEVAMVCRGEGSVVIDNLRGSRVVIEATGGAIVAAGLASDGVLYLSTADQPFMAVAPGSTHAARVTWPGEWTGSVVADSLAVNDGLVALAQRSGDSAYVRVFDPRSMGQRKSWRLAGVPNAGLLALWPFAYYTVGATVRHVDLTSGLLETMTEVGEGAVPAAVVNG